MMSNMLQDHDIKTIFAWEVFERLLDNARVAQRGLIWQDWTLLLQRC